MSVIIFEGHDRCGKTTIANAVAKRLKTEVFMTNSKECFTEKGIFDKDSSNIALFNYSIALYISALKLSKKIDKPIIIYRSFLSEMVYSRLLERKTNKKYNDLTESVFATLNATIILCKNSTSFTFNDELLGDDLINKSIVLYDELKNIVDVDILEIDTSDHDIEKYVDQIISYVKAKALY